jgi:hypothetical protein
VVVPVPPLAIGRVPVTSEVRDTDPVVSVPPDTLTLPVPNAGMVKAVMVVEAKVEVPVALKVPVTEVEAKVDTPVTPKVPPTVIPPVVETLVKEGVLDTAMVEVPVTEIFDPAVRRDDISL